MFLAIYARSCKPNFPAHWKRAIEYSQYTIAQNILCGAYCSKAHAENETKDENKQYLRNQTQRTKKKSCVVGWFVFSAELPTYLW